MTANLFLYAEGQGVVGKSSPTIFQFPGGEWHLKDLPEIKPEWRDGGKLWYVADVRGANTNDLMQASLWNNVPRWVREEGRDGDPFALMLPYLPAARADRGVPFGVGMYANLVNVMEAERVLIMDPHSPVGPARLHNDVTVVEHDSLIAEAFDGIELQAIICPDEGAKVRAESAANYMGLDVYYCEKHRDFETGQLSGFKVPELPRGGRFLVVDDICDGGGTFRGLAQASGVGRDHLALWVTHGVFSGPAAHLRENFRWIATTDSHPGSSKAGIATCVMPVFDHMLSYL